jgi:transposase-like protein
VRSSDKTVTQVAKELGLNRETLCQWVKQDRIDRIAGPHRELVCGANLAMLQALTDRLGGDPPVRAALDPQPGTCCVALTPKG